MSAVRKIALEVQWRIVNIQSWLQKRDDALYSPQILAETLRKTRWKLSLSPNWQLEEKYFSLALQRDIEDDGPELIDLHYEFSFLASDGRPLKSKSFKLKFAPKTVSQELNVKQVEILVEKKNVYLPEGVLTVCCKMWNTLSSVSKQGQCSSLRSVIGKKGLKLVATVNNFGVSSNAVVDFLPPSTDINLISLHICMSPHEHKGGVYRFVFKRKHVECKKFCWYSFKLFAVGVDGFKKEFYEILNISNSSALHNYMDDYRNYLPNNTLTLELLLFYNPGVVSDCTDTKFNDYENLSCKAENLEDLKTCDSQRPNSNISDDLPSTNPSIQGSQSNDKSEESSNADGKMCLPLTDLKDDMASMYKDLLFCDTKLQTENETFPAHRCVLSARSPVFKKMFKTDMKEKAGECINVPDISSDTVRRMLQFIYTDCTGELEMQSAKDLYIASDKYDIASLKKYCSSFMKTNLCPSNVCDVLVLADMHQDKDLESAAQEYVFKNDEEVFYSDEWKLFMKNYGGLAAQVMYLKFTKK